MVSVQVGKYTKAEDVKLTDGIWMWLRPHSVNGINDKAKTEIGQRIVPAGLRLRSAPRQT